MWLLFVLGCGLALAATARADEAASARLRGWLTAGVELPASLKGLSSRSSWGRLYAARDYRPLWFDQGRPNERVQQLREAVAGLYAEGIDPPARLADWEAELPAGEDGAAPMAAERIAALDLQLTDTLLTVATLLSSGVTQPAALDPTWHLPANRLDLKALEGVFNGGEAVTAALAKLSPQTAEYRRLREALADYRACAAAGETWVSLPEGPTLRPGDIAPEVAVLRQRLLQGGELAPAAAEIGAQWPELYDDPLAEAVKAFQARHGLTEDAEVGPKTRAALNASLDQRIAQLRAVLERWRWMPRPGPGKYLLVNTAGFRLALYKDGQPDLEMRVIVGVPDKKWATPSFTAPVQSLVLNPYWNVPRNILYDEVLPDALADPAYLERKRIRLLDETGEEVALSPEELRDLAQGGNFPYRLRQDAGAGNALGRVKLMLPNQFDIYLHDTNRPWLFQRSYRAFSHGCIRLEKPLTLAARLLGDDWDEAKLNAAAATAKNRTLKLPAPTPAYIVYLTAWVEANGRVQFREDHYRREGPLLAAFQPAPSERVASRIADSAPAM